MKKKYRIKKMYFSYRETIKSWIIRSCTKKSMTTTKKTKYPQSNNHPAYANFFLQTYHKNLL